MTNAKETVPKRSFSQRFVRSLKKHWQYYIRVIQLRIQIPVFSQSCR